MQEDWQADDLDMPSTPQKGDAAQLGQLPRLWLATEMDARWELVLRSAVGRTRVEAKQNLNRTPRRRRAT